MAVKTIINAQYSKLAFYVPMGIGRKNRWWTPMLVVSGDNVERPLKVNAFREHLRDYVTRAEFAGQSDSRFRMIEDVNTRPANLTTLEYILVVKMYNDNAKARMSMILPPIKSTFDKNEGSADMLALEACIKDNLSILVKNDAGENDNPVKITRVDIFPVKIKQHDAAPAEPGVDAVDDIQDSTEQVPAAA